MQDAEPQNPPTFVAPEFSSVWMRGPMSRKLLRWAAVLHALCRAACSLRWRPLSHLLARMEAAVEALDGAKDVDTGELVPTAAAPVTVKVCNGLVGLALHSCCVQSARTCFELLHSLLFELSMRLTGHFPRVL